MVTGMETFKQYFAGFEDSFVLIGGAACDAWFTRVDTKSDSGPMENGRISVSSNPPRRTTPR